MDFARIREGLRRRKMVTWTAAYVTAAAALLGTLETIGNAFGWPPGVLRAAFFLLLAGLAATLIVSWYHGERGRQRVSTFEALLLVCLTVAGAAGAWWSLASVEASEGFDAETRTAASEPADVQAARNAYAEGEEALLQRTPATVVQAIGKYREAAELDPGMAAAPAREAYAFGLYLDWGWTYPGLASDDLLERAFQLTDRALEIDSTSAEAWLARAYLLLLSDREDPSAALSAYSRAVTLDPTNAEAQHQYGQTLMSMGRYTEARSAYHAALAIEPERPMTLVALSAMARWTGDDEQARRWADSSVALGADAPYAWVSRALNTMDTRDPAAVAADAREALRIDPSYEVYGRAMLAGALWRQGKREGAERELARGRAALVDPDTPGTTDALYLGAALVYMDRHEEALELLEATRPRNTWLWFYLQSPAFDPLRDDERFQAVVEDAAPRGTGSESRPG